MAGGKVQCVVEYTFRLELCGNKKRASERADMKVDSGSNAA